MGAWRSLWFKFKYNKGTKYMADHTIYVCFGWMLRGKEEEKRVVVLFIAGTYGTRQLDLGHAFFFA